ncbi:hypothetical protein EKN06_14625 [Croceicoccus ponticola]|uniref:Uncharacterized protein n=2 Tax=Croceicoccus ponticola TaxID=2217664 RepID=A0A437GUE1_9SPHN|nr:hypothetical protein EKN06_14625 [Croceicoccus ponticola]
MANAAASHSLAAARALVAEMFNSMRRTDLGALVAAGEADDFPEVVIARTLLQEQADQTARQGEALRQYADPSFWDEESPGGALAAHDRG